MYIIMIRIFLVLFFTIPFFSQEISEECGTAFDQNFYDVKNQKLDDFNYFLNEYNEKRQHRQHHILRLHQLLLLSAATPSLVLIHNSLCIQERCRAASIRELNWADHEEMN